jgi:hypothetical protein
MRVCPLFVFSSLLLVSLPAPVEAGIFLRRPKPNAEWEVGQNVEVEFKHDRGCKRTHLKIFRFGQPSKVYLDQDVSGKGTNPVKVEFKVPRVQASTGTHETIIVEIRVIQRDGYPASDQIKVMVKSPAAGAPEKKEKDDKSLR